ncbi:hypothetical protein [Bosea sp. NBC_00550]|uniref:hypothetical protein n=1 Tax=Bosea sp. NBC_00550 TaxID=2969621 RepID=UPI002230DD02|nr:hypothetical protein [Bosea sp. NBC_00550]UZF91008.1 hypothetical protein NWE53_17930 [Bosea sp. NBC_00550]
MSAPVGWALAGMVICTPAHAAGDDMPTLFGVLIVSIPAALGFAFRKLSRKSLAALIAAIWVGGLVLAIGSYGVAGVTDRSSKFALLMSCLTIPLAGGWLVGHAARKRLSGIGMRHG